MSLFKRKDRNENKKSSKSKEQTDIVDNPQIMLFARLLFDSEPEFIDDEINKQLNKNFGKFERPEDNKGDRMRQYFFPGYPVKFQEGTVPAQFGLFKTDTDKHIKESLELGYRQLWHWSEGKTVTQNCKYELVISDILTRVLPYKTRVEAFNKFVISICSALQPVAVYFPSSEKLVDPNSYIQYTQGENPDVLYGLLNIRLFKIENQGILMDSLGLFALGLPDFQMQFTDYEAGTIAGLLNSYSHYIYEYGDVIENGNTVEGIEPGSKWKCIHNNSLLQPERKIIEIKDK